MSPPNHINGTIYLWKWGDQEIENPKHLRVQLIKLAASGFSGVLISIQNTRYDFFNPIVLRTIAQVSQWSKRRNINFWIQVDPRHASRTLIQRTNERLQNLLVLKNQKKKINKKNLCITKIKNNHFKLSLQIPSKINSSIIQERAIHFEPNMLEKVFLFQMDENQVISNSIKDITSYSYMFSNMDEGVVEIFGFMKAPPDEEWWIAAFPKLDTNLYDYAGRESNDSLLEFTENLFDACTHLDGVTWGNQGVGYISDWGRFPVSLSIYNSFLAEYRYNLKDVLLGLILEIDDGSHVRVRCDYYSLLMDLVYGAKKDFNMMMNSFFIGLQGGIHHFQYLKNKSSIALVQGCIDPWRSLDLTQSIFCEMEKDANVPQSLLAVLLLAKSLGFFSRNKQGFLKLWDNDIKGKKLAYAVDLIAQFSLYWIAHSQSNVNSKPKSFLKDNFSDSSEFLVLNQKRNKINTITNSLFPEADTALVFPTETIMASEPVQAGNIISTVLQLVTRLGMAGIQMDVISSSILKESKIQRTGLRVRDRLYTSLIYPYPEILDPQVLETISVMVKLNLSVYLGGSSPKYTSAGKPIPNKFNISFDPQEDDLSPFWKGGLKKLIDGPENTIITMIKQGNGFLFLLNPNRLGGFYKGKINYKNISFSVQKCSTLSIYSATTKGSVERLL